MNNVAAFKNEIIKYSIFIALGCEAASIIFLGLNLQFAYGLALGTAICVVNFNISYFFINRTLKKINGAKLRNFIGYVLRLTIYGYAFYVSIMTGKYSAIGTVAGFLSIKASIYYINVIKYKNKYNPRSKKWN